MRSDLGFGDQEIIATSQEDHMLTWERWPSAGRGSSSIAEERQADGVSLDSHSHGGDNI